MLDKTALHDGVISQHVLAVNWQNIMQEAKTELNPQLWFVLTTDDYTAGQQIITQPLKWSSYGKLETMLSD